MPRPKKDPNVVSDSTCKGCVYYAPLAETSISSSWCCTYAIDTGHCRPAGETCATCSVKRTETGPRQRRRVDIHIEGPTARAKRMERRERREIDDAYDPGEIACTAAQSLKSIREGKL